MNAPNLAISTQIKSLAQPIIYPHLAFPLVSPMTKYYNLNIFQSTAWRDLIKNTSAIIFPAHKKRLNLSNLKIEHISTISGPFLEAMLLRYAKFLTPGSMNSKQKRVPSFISLMQRFVSSSWFPFQILFGSDFTRLHYSGSRRSIVTVSRKI